MMTNEQQLIEKYRGAALRFWFEPESSYEMEFESYEEFYEYLFKDIALCPKGMSREAYIVARCYYIFEYEVAVERVLSGIHSARHFDSDWARSFKKVFGVSPAKYRQNALLPSGENMIP